MQLMCTGSEEGDTIGLDIFNVDVERFRESVKVPQIQWNTINNLSSPLFNQVAEDSFIYMVHSFYAPVVEDTIATTTYGLPYSSALAKNNFYGTQFHPEKSSAVGEQILKNFLEL
jgi:glutamine amidotransferase